MQNRPILFNVGAWSQHVPFAYDLVKEFKPRVLVELGTHKGESYFAFCQSVKDHNLQTICYAVDSWQGDHQAGFYGNEIFDSVNEINRNNFQHFSYLLRSFFDDAALQFSNESIDLLHIDGLHTYEAVKNDFETWLPKMSSKGIILFHDIMVRHQDFGVWKLWEELRKRYATFAFSSGYGLGVLILNPEEHKNNTFLTSLFDESNSLRLNSNYQNEYDKIDALDKLNKTKWLLENEIKKNSQIEVENNDFQKRVTYLTSQLAQTDTTLKIILQSRSWRFIKIIQKIKNFIKKPL